MKSIKRGTSHGVGEGWGLVYWICSLAQRIVDCNIYRKLSRAISESQIWPSCGFKGGKLDLSIREWECLNCGAKHDRDENAARNILVPGGHTETLNGHGGKHKTTVKVAAACEMLTRLGAKAR